MTIKELEARTGMDRANIRYYEREGLLSPRRLDNGYRDYSEEDVSTLEKIKLLRSLHLDIDTIRLVQKGELPLERALFTLLTRLEGDRAHLDRAAEICRRLQSSGVEYAALEPEPWLDQLTQPARPRMPAPPPPPDPPNRRLPTLEAGTEWAKDHPFRRLFARMTDLAIYSVAVQAALLLGFRWNWTQAGSALFGTAQFYQWCVEALLPCALMILCEPFLLHHWGWTPGKWIFGLKVRWDRSGKKLSVGEGLVRTVWVFLSGLGLSIPLVNLWRGLRCWYWYRDGQDCPWDSENQYVYTCDLRRQRSGLWFLAVEGLSLACMVLIFFQAWMPPNRGGLTVAQFAENYNFYRRFTGYEDAATPMDGEGQWTGLRNGEDSTAQLDRTVTYRTGPDGIVIAVTFTEEGQGQERLLDATSDEFYLAALALEGSRRETSLFDFQRYRSILMGPTHRGLQAQDGTWEYGGLRGEWTVAYTGYREGNGMLLEAVEGEEQTFSRTVTISLQNP